MSNKVLIVEDSHSLAKMLSAALNYGEYQVSVANNGEEAIEFIKQEDFNLIILDLMMPIMDGKEFLSWLREDVCKNTPVLVYTGSQAIDLEKDLMKDGADKVAFKPLGATKLLELVKQLIK